MYKDIIENWRKYCIKDNFIGIGSTRKAFKFSHYVIKLHLHPIGHKQSQNELIINNVMNKNGLHELFAETYYVDKKFSIQKYYHPLELIDNQSFEINTTQHATLLPNRYEEVLDLLDKDFDSFDLKDSSNYGLNEEGKLIFIDYGMSKKLYEREWVPLAESGILPQIDFDYCRVCGQKRELRMYGDHDSDRRCYDCGKE